MVRLSRRKSNPYGMSLILGGSWKGISLNANISSSWGGYSTYAGGSYIFMNENSLMVPTFRYIGKICSFPKM